MVTVQTNGIKITCKDCGDEFPFIAKERLFYPEPHSQSQRVPEL